MHESQLPRRQVILDLLDSQTRAMHAREIAARLHVEESAYPHLLHLLDDLADTGVIRLMPGQRFGARPGQPRGDAGQRRGILTVNPRGFGFVASVGHDDDLWIPEESMAGAMHGDAVVARLVGRTSRGSEGAVVEVIERSNQRVAGVLRRRGHALWLEPDDTRLRGPILVTEAEDAADGQSAVVRITRFPEVPRETPEGVLAALLGRPGDPEVEVAKILARDQIEEEHPEEAVAEAEAYGSEVDPAALAGREDFTGVPLPTIDPEDARDHDDAVWAVRRPDGTYTAWIAIADVSHYVRPGTPLDAAALARGCSIYLPDRAIPMLPRALSSNLCSLLPHVVRLCLCVVAELDAAGDVTSFRISPGYMRSSAKLTYGGVARALGWTDKPKQSAEAEAVVDDLRVLAELSAVLRAKRMRRGALDFDLPEPKVIFDEKGAPTSIEKRTEDPGVKKAYRVIEELMLLANELVARHLTERGVPAIYRVHGAPDEQKLERFATMCEQLGVPFDPEEAKDPKKLSALLKRIAKHPSHDVLHMLLLRAMKQAQYDTANIGHFGLASTAYLHFTSPIRRYPDMAVHRTVKALHAGAKVDRSDAAEEKLKDAALRASFRERASMDVEREVLDLYRALYMQQRTGEVFAGTVTAVVGTGAFVRIDSPFVDVLVKYDDLGPDLYKLDEDGLRAVGQRSGDVVGLGDRIEVLVTDVSVLRRSIYGKRLASVRRDHEPAPRKKRVVSAPPPRAGAKKRSDRAAKPGRNESPKAGSRAAPPPARPGARPKKTAKKKGSVRRRGG